MCIAPSAAEQEEILPEPLASTSDFIDVGRTESTLHLVCSIRSSIPELPFTRLISSKIDPILKTKNGKSNLEIKPERLDQESAMDIDPDEKEVSSNSVNNDSSPLENCNGVKQEVVGPNNVNNCDVKMKTDISKDSSETAVSSNVNPLSISKNEKSESPESKPSLLIKWDFASLKKSSKGKKRSLKELEEESWSPDEASLCVTPEWQEFMSKRILCTGMVLRNLSFIPGNDEVMGKTPAFMVLLGRLILLHHSHPNRLPSTPHYDKEDDADMGDWCSSLSHDNHWWWPYVHHLHEMCLVTLCNMAGYCDLSLYSEDIIRPIVEGLLHWATCPSSYGQDPLPSGGVGPTTALSPQRLALEALVKFCVLDQNTDLVLATPTFTQLETLCSQLTRMVCRGEDQVIREFSINLLHYFSAADTKVARLIAMQNGCVSQLVSFIEEAEHNAMTVANTQGVNALKDNPELMGTSLDMVRRTANTLVHLSKVPDNARILATCESRLLNLVMSQILDTYVASQLSNVLFNVSQATRNTDSPPVPESSSPQSSSENSKNSEGSKKTVVAVVCPAPSQLGESNASSDEARVCIASLADITRDKLSNGKLESAACRNVPSVKEDKASEDEQESKPAAASSVVTNVPQVNGSVKGRNDLEKLTNDNNRLNHPKVEEPVDKSSDVSSRLSPDHDDKNLLQESTKPSDPVDDVPSNEIKTNGGSQVYNNESKSNHMRIEDDTPAERISVENTKSIHSITNSNHMSQVHTTEVSKDKSSHADDKANNMDSNESIPLTNNYSSNNREHVNKIANIKCTGEDSTMNNVESLNNIVNNDHIMS